MSRAPHHFRPSLRHPTNSDNCYHSRHCRCGRAGTWAIRTGCAAAIAGVVVLYVYRPPVGVATSSAPDPQVCAVVESLLDVAFVGLSPPPESTPEDFAAVERINERLSQTADALRASEPMKELGCG